jgi:hypothetical protein
MAAALLIAGLAMFPGDFVPAVFFNSTYIYRYDCFLILSAVLV